MKEGMAEATYRSVPTDEVQPTDLHLLDDSAPWLVQHLLGGLAVVARNSVRETQRELAHQEVEVGSDQFDPLRVRIEQDRVTINVDEVGHLEEGAHLRVVVVMVLSLVSP